jgi:hypothetical protein
MLTKKLGFWGLPTAGHRILRAVNYTRECKPSIPMFKKLYYGLTLSIIERYSQIRIQM